jgi:hypothetical protein
MALILPNLVTPFIKGLLGSIVFKRRRGKGYVAMKPIPSGQAPSAGQQEVRSRFRLAAIYGNGAVDDVAATAFYQPIATEKGASVYSVAMADYLKPPLVDTIDLSGYSGVIGNKIAVVGLDDAGVASLHVAIKTLAGVTLEQGQAVASGGAWLYTATTNLTAGQSVSIVATAKDRPGNVGLKTVTYQKP